MADGMKLSRGTASLLLPVSLDSAEAIASLATGSTRYRWTPFFYRKASSCSLQSSVTERESVLQRYAYRLGSSIKLYDKDASCKGEFWNLKTVPRTVRRAVPRAVPNESTNWIFNQYLLEVEREKRRKELLEDWKSSIEWLSYKESERVPCVGLRFLSFQPIPPFASLPAVYLLVSLDSSIGNTDIW